MVYERDNFREHDIVENSNYDFPERNANFRDSIPPRDRNNWNSWRSDRDQRDRDARDIPQNLSIRGGGVRKQRNWPPSDARDKDFNRMRELNRRHTSINLLDSRKADFQRFRSSAPNIPHIKEDLNPNQNNEGMMEDPFHKKRWENGNINPIANMEQHRENAQSISIGGPILPKVAPVSAMKDFKHKKDKSMDESPVREEEPPPPPKFQNEEVIDTPEEFLPTKQEIIQDMDKLDMEMGDIKVELEKFRKLKADSHKPKDRSNLSIIERIVLDNQEKALEHTKLMKDYEIAETEKVHHLVVYHTDPLQSYIYRPRMVHYLRKRLFSIKQKEKILAETYLYHKYQWDIRLKSLNLDHHVHSPLIDSTNECSGNSSEIEQNSENNQSPKENSLSYSTRRNSRNRKEDDNNNNNNNNNNNEKNDSLSNKPDEELTMRYLKTLANSVPMILDEVELSRKFIDNNRKIENSLQEYQNYKLTNPWTVEEQEIFLKRYLLFPKQFTKIASFLQNKSIEDVISFYYQNKLRLDLKRQLSRKRQRRYLTRTREPAPDLSNNNINNNNQIGLWKEPINQRNRTRNRANDMLNISPLMNSNNNYNNNNYGDKNEKKVKEEEVVVKRKPGKPAKNKSILSSPSLTPIKDSPKLTAGRKRLNANNNTNNNKKKSKKDSSPPPSPSSNAHPQSPSDDPVVISPLRSPLSPRRSPSPPRKAKTKANSNILNQSKTLNKPSSPSLAKKSPPSSPTHSKSRSSSSSASNPSLNSTPNNNNNSQPKIRTSNNINNRNNANNAFCEDDTPTPWTDVERDLFKRAFVQSTLDFKAIADFIGSKNQFQCRSYYYNIFQFLNPSTLINNNNKNIKP